MLKSLYPHLEEKYGKTTKLPTPPDNILDFAQTIKLGLGSKFTFEGREFMKEILLDDSQTIAVLKSRQIGWTVTMGVLMAYYAMKYSGISLMYCSFDREHTDDLSRQKLKPFLKDQGVVFDRNEDRIKSFRLPNQSSVRFVSSFDGFRNSIGYSVDVLFLDEAQKLPLDSLLKITETMTQSKFREDGKLYIGGTGGMVGSSWEKYWNNTTQSRWLNNKWQDTQQARIKGYHITQRMLPNWSQQREDKKRAENTPADFDTEVLGTFTAHVDIPLTPDVVLKCMTDTYWLDPTPNTIASLDLAAGGDSDTILTISEIKDDTVNVLYMERMADELSDALYEKIQPVLERYNPDHIVSDMGGNKELRHKLATNHKVQFFQLGQNNQPVRYNDTDVWAVDRSFFMQKVISRFHHQHITIPNVEPWILDQLTSLTSDTVHKKEGGSYLRFGKRDKDDAFMSLVFLECFLYTMSDENNPVNKEVGWTVV